MVYICMICYIIVTIIILYLNCLFPNFLLLKLKSVFFLISIDESVHLLIIQINTAQIILLRPFEKKIYGLVDITDIASIFLPFFFFFCCITSDSFSVNKMSGRKFDTGWQLESCFRTRGKFKIYHIIMTVTTTKKGISLHGF